MKKLQDQAERELVEDDEITIIRDDFDFGPRPFDFETNDVGDSYVDAWAEWSPEGGFRLDPRLEPLHDWLAAKAAGQQTPRRDWSPMSRSRLQRAFNRAKHHPDAVEELHCLVEDYEGDPNELDYPALYQERLERVARAECEYEGAASEDVAASDPEADEALIAIRHKAPTVLRKITSWGSVTDEHVAEVNAVLSPAPVRIETKRQRKFSDPCKGRRRRDSARARSSRRPAPGRTQGSRRSTSATPKTRTASRSSGGGSSGDDGPGSDQPPSGRRDRNPYIDPIGVVA
jgi:hypothetical protein